MLRKLWPAVVTVTGFAALISLAAPAAAQTVSRPQFREILTELTARPNIRPRIVAPKAEPAKAGAVSDDSAAMAANRKACGMPRRDVIFSVPHRIENKDDDGPPLFKVDTERLPILADAGRPNRGAVFAVTDKFAVNADGAPRSYHPLDPFGRCSGEGSARVCAIDALCNAGTRLFDGDEEIKCSQRDAYKAAWAEMWSQISAGRATLIPRRYWRMDRTGRTSTHFGYFHPDKPMTVILRHNILARDAKLRPCVRDVSGAKYAGYFVSKTSLKGDQGTDEQEGHSAEAIVSDARCNPLPYTDPEVLPGTVIPVGGFAGARVGDLAVVYRKDENGVERFVYAVISDEGPNHKFGEGNIALNAALKGVAVKVETIKDIYALDIRSKGDRRETIAVLILRGTSRRHYASLSRRAIETATDHAFKAWGGGTLDTARNRFLACLGALQ